MAINRQAYIKFSYGASLVAQTVKRLPAMRETWVQFLGQEDLLEKEMATQSSIPAWKIPWTGKPGMLQSMGCKESDMPKNTHIYSELPWWLRR